MRIAAGAALTAALAMAGCASDEAPEKAVAADVREFAVVYPNAAPRNSCDPQPNDVVHPGSTHEIAFDHKRPGEMWITGQNYDRLVAITPATARMRFLEMPAGSGPHGIEYDSAGQLWVTLECLSRVVRVDGQGNILEEHDVSLPDGKPTRPHGLGIGADGRSIWFTGKLSGTLGRISDGKLTVFRLADHTSMPIYIKAGPDGSMWATELAANRIARVTPDGKLVEYDIPFRNSRPIAIVPGPDGAMWFSEEAGSRIGRIDTAGNITEYVVPKPEGHPNMLLAALAFDGAGDLWVQQYVDQLSAGPAGKDYILRIAAAGLKAGPEGLEPVHVTRYPVETRNTVMHRIIQGPDKAMWFTEMHSDKLGRLAVK